MPSQLCIHGHFYQPPRENPWLGSVFPEPSAAPAPDWNTRILRESYAPLAYARRLDGQGRIEEIMNCYEWMSFNIGPTLRRWLRLNAPETLARMAEGDTASLARLGHGNAIAQVYHHSIMPLATEEERRVQIAWAVADFEETFGRRPEGLWLAEAAVDIPTLESLAEQNIKFTILAPGQARAFSGPDGNWISTAEQPLDISRPYKVELPSGRSVAVFFYDGALSQAVAFERLLADGASFWRKLSDSARQGNGLLSLCTDGETYGHHFTFGEMALAYVLAKARNADDGVGLTNFAAFLAANPPQSRVQLHEPSSWSCAHGVQRWLSDCGCTNGDHPGWNQQWRTPLREALRETKNMTDAHFAETGAALFVKSETALLEYGRVLAAPDSAAAALNFAEQHFRPGLDATAHGRAWQLLAMQESALASFASCAWFFDDISRIEPLNALTYALRSLELAAGTGAAVSFNKLLAILERARSNRPEEGTGKDLFLRRVAPRSLTPGKLALHALCDLYGRNELPAPGSTASRAWPDIVAEITLAPEERGANGAITGECAIRLPLENKGRRFAFSWLPPDNAQLAHPLDSSIALTALEAAAAPSLHIHVEQAKSDNAHCLLTDPCVEGEVASCRDLPSGARQALVNCWLEADTARAARYARRHVPLLLGFLPPLEPEQRDLSLAPLWANWSAHALPALLEQPGLMEFAEAHVREFLRANNLSPRQLELRKGMVSAHLLACLDTGGNSPDWLELLRKRDVLTKLMPDVDLWAVQNALWMRRSRCMGNPDAARCFEAYGFAPQPGPQLQP